MIFNRLAEKCGFTMEQVLDLTPRVTWTYMVDEVSLRRADVGARENEIREKIRDSKKKGRRLLVMKFEKELDEHLAKVEPDRKRVVDAMKAQIVNRIRNG